MLRRRQVSILVLVSSLVVLAPAIAQSPPVQFELNGFLLGQSKSSIEALGKPDTEIRLRTGWLARTYTTDQANHGTMVFMFEPFPRNEVVWGIRIAGDSGTRMLPFLGLTIGGHDTTAARVLGPPSAEKRDSTGTRLFRFPHANYTLGVDGANRIVSIEISVPAIAPTLADSVPGLAPLKAALSAQDLDALLMLLAPDVVLKQGGNDYAYRGGARAALSDSSSPIRRLIMAGPKSLAAAMVLGDSAELKVHRARGNCIGISRPGAATVCSFEPPTAEFSFKRNAIVETVRYKVGAGRWWVSEVDFR